MTISIDTAKVTALGNGVATVFSGNPLKIFDEDELRAVKVDAGGNETALVRGLAPANYKVTLLNLNLLPSAFNVTYPADEATPLPSGEQLVIKLNLPSTQLVDLENQGGYFPDTQEQMHDRTIMLVNQRKEEVDRAVKTSLTEETLVSLELPNTAAVTGGQGLVLSADKTKIEFGSISGTLPDPVTLAKGGTGATTASAARANLGLQLVESFVPHQAEPTADLTVKVNAGRLFIGDTDPIEKAQQTTAAFVAPSVNSRVDRIVMDRFTGVISVIAGAEAASPVPPAITESLLPIAQVALTTSTTEITDIDLTDEHDLRLLGGLAINWLTTITAPALADLLPIYDDSIARDRKITLPNLLKVINLLTEDTTPDIVADFVVTYDVSASEAKKAKLSALGGLPRSYLAGIETANNSTDVINDLDFTAGETRDDGDANDLVFSANTRAIDAVFAEGGPGFRDSTDNLTGAKTFHLYAIGGAGKTDDLFASDSVTPTLPTGFTYKRRVFSRRWTGSAWEIGTQRGDSFRLDAIIQNLTTNPAVTTGVLQAMSAPLGIETMVRLIAKITDTSGDFLLVTSPSETDTIASAAAYTITNSGSAATSAQNTECERWTNTSAEIRWRISSTTINNLELSTIGWTDRRGRDA